MTGRKTRLLLSLEADGFVGLQNTIKDFKLGYRNEKNLLNFVSKKFFKKI